MYSNYFDGIEVDIIDPLEHVNVVERSMRAMKEGVRYVAQSLPFRRIPKLMLRRIVAAVTRNLN